MATFFVLPPRECLEHALTEFLGRVLPGLSPSPLLWEELLERLSGADRYFVHREDVPPDEPLAEALRAGFGAEPGDTVVEVGLAGDRTPASVRQWVLPGTVSERAVVR